MKTTPGANSMRFGLLMNFGSKHSSSPPCPLCDALLLTLEKGAQGYRRLINDGTNQVDGARGSSRLAIGPAA